MGILIDSLESNDFMEMESALSAWDHRYRQIGRGAFSGSLFLTQAGSLGLFRNRWERAIHYQGVAPKGTVALAITLNQSNEGRWMGQRLGFDDLIVAGCEVEGEYRSASLWDSIVCTIPEAELAQQIAEITHDDPEKFIALGIARLSPQAAAQVRQATLSYLGEIQQFGARPALQSMLMERASALVELLAQVLVDSRRPRCMSVPLHKQRQIIRKTEKYVYSLGDQPLRIGLLCRELGVNERTLQYAFRRAADTSPLSYLKTQRLNQARRALHAAGPGEVRIKVVTYSHGFRHLGNFCKDYKQLFGETPSDTLRRRR